MKWFANFWRQALALRNSVLLHITLHVIGFGVIAAMVCAAAWYAEHQFNTYLGLDVAPYEIAGGILGLLLVLRTNAGYDRWWEARKLWGGMVNQSRNLVITALAYGPNDTHWRQQFVQWAAAFAHTARASLRGQRNCPEVAVLVGQEAAAQISAADHAPSFVALTLAKLLRDATEKFHMDHFAFLQADRERALLIDHLGGCERILKSPLPLVYSIEIHRFLMLFLVTLPFGLLHKVSAIWLIPLITILVAFPLMALDQMGIELQNPFATENLGHLPLDEITATIERNLRGDLAITLSPPAVHEQ
ncbi:MAG TPA: bestrophin family ion channel [Pirellulales bacterium]|jgi:putative membrane protein|nr:bestrophin family ion channel [Pirellulales bacterium]